MGSGGGGAHNGSNGGDGGGAIKIKVNGELINNGDILLNCINASLPSSRYSAGGGAGGSIWLDVDIISGDGNIFANGGYGGDKVYDGGGGGGGRIAINYNDNNFIGSTTAYGGWGYASIYGGAGTIYMKNKASSTGDLTIDNQGYLSEDRNLATTTIPALVNEFNYNESAYFYVDAGMDFTFGGSNDGDLTFVNRFENNGIFTDNGLNTIVFDNYFLEILETPGHNWSCLTFKIQNYLFTGDSYIPGVAVVTKLKGGDGLSNRKSLKKIMEMEKRLIIKQR
jgi:hypothetical protein